MSTPTSPERLREHVEALGRPRNPTTHLEDHRQARYYLENFLRAQDRAVQLQPFPTSQDGLGLNLLSPAGGDEPPRFLLVAHYDTVDHSPGADDNASAVAVALEVAAQCPHIALLLPDLEERGLQGARHFVDSGIWKEIPSLVLESVGYWSDDANSQRFPEVLPLAFPEAHRRLADNDFRGDFLALLHLSPEQALATDLQSALLGKTIPLAVPSDLLAGPGAETLYDFGRSDHLAFWQGQRACLMLTDSANFRNPNYHQPSDTADSLDYERMAELVRGLNAFFSLKPGDKLFSKYV